MQQDAFKVLNEIFYSPSLAMQSMGEANDVTKTAITCSNANDYLEFYMLSYSICTLGYFHQPIIKSNVGLKAADFHGL